MRSRPEHGTPQRYKWELRHDGHACPECMSAWTEFHRHYRKNRNNRSSAYSTSMKEAGYKITRTASEQRSEQELKEEVMTDGSTI